MQERLRRPPGGGGGGGACGPPPFHGPRQTPRSDDAEPLMAAEEVNKKKKIRHPYPSPHIPNPTVFLPQAHPQAVLTNGEILNIRRGIALPSSPTLLNSSLDTPKIPLRPGPQLCLGRHAFFLDMPDHAALQSRNDLFRDAHLPVVQIGI